MKLTIGMCCYDDFDGVWFTIQSIKMYHPECIDDIKFVVIDGNPDQPHGQACERLIDKLTNKHGKNGLYVKNVTWASTASRDYIFQFAETPYVLCVDSHVMIQPGAIKKLINYYDNNPGCENLLQGPLIDDDHQPFANHMLPAWEFNMYGKWINETTYHNKTEPYEVPMMGLGLFSSTKKSWLGFNKLFKGFGGEEGYIHRKYKKAGHKTLILPWLKWLHRFDRPAGVKYTNEYVDRIKNYFTGWAELGDNPQEIIDYFSTANTNPGQEREAISVEILKNMQRECAEENAKIESQSNNIKNIDSQSSETENDLKQHIRRLEEKIEEMSKAFHRT